METIRQRHNSFKRTHETPLNLEGPSDPINEGKITGSFLNNDVAEVFSAEELEDFDKKHMGNKGAKEAVTSKDILNQQQRQNMQSCSPLGECGHEEATLPDKVEVVFGKYLSGDEDMTIGEYSINTKNRLDRELIDNANRSYILNEETDNNKSVEPDCSLKADKAKIKKAEEGEKKSNGNLNTNGKG